MNLLVSFRVWMLPIIGMAFIAPALAAGAHTGHQFAVTESGAATITIPIQVPRGIGGMEPQLSLNYSSGTGNGLLGLGWALSGPSAVTRCPKTLLHDNVRGGVIFGVGDRFCLDGQRLVLLNLANTDANYGLPNTVYATERDSFSRITAIGTFQGMPNTPNSFRVETKAGLILDFGLSANSQVLTKFGTGMGADTINRWMLQRMADRHGNFVEFVYCGGEVRADGAACDATAWSGSKVLHYIRYTNRDGALNGTSGVVFGYETRSDIPTHFHYGSSFKQTQRLSRIDTYIGFGGPAVDARGSRVRRYTLVYEAPTNRTTSVSRLASIQESNGAETPQLSDQLPALEMTYALDAVFGLPPPSGATPLPAVLPCGGVVRFRTALCP